MAGRMEMERQTFLVTVKSILVDNLHNVSGMIPTQQMK